MDYKKKIVIVFLLLFLPVSVFAQTRAYRTLFSQNIQNNTETKVQLNAETYDVLNEFDPTNYRFIATADGYYQVNASIFWDSSIDQSEHSIMIFKNGVVSTLGDVESSGTRYFVQTISDTIYLEVGDYLELWCWQQTGGTIAIYPGESLTFISIHKFYSYTMPDFYTLIQNATTDAEFYLDKTISYGDILVVVFLSIFMIFIICKAIASFIFKQWN